MVSILPSAYLLFPDIMTTDNRRLTREHRGLRPLGCFGLLFALLLTGPLQAAAPSAEAGYRLQPGDIIHVSVWREEGLDQDVMVRPDGGISFPFVGNLEAKGMTVDELASAISRKIERYIPGPVITVSVKEIVGNVIHVLGRVNKPGSFVVPGDVTVMQALAKAGGLTPYAERRDIKILRTENGKQRAIPFNYKQVEQGRALQQNIDLQAGDVVVVP